MKKYLRDVELQKGRELEEDRKRQGIYTQRLNNQHIHYSGNGSVNSRSSRRENNGEYPKKKRIHEITFNGGVFCMHPSSAAVTTYDQEEPLI